MLKEKVVIITGASSGVGAETAKLLAEHGAIPILMARSIEKLQQVSQEIKGKHDVFQLDVTSNGQIESVFNQVIEKYGKVDILINSAGFAIFDYFIEANLEDYEEMMEVNYMGTVKCTKAVLPLMMEKKEGQIINIASVAGKLGSAKAAGYSATKFAVLGFSNSLRAEMKEHGIIISTVNPGPIDTPFFDRADPTGNYVKNVKWFMLTPQKVAKKVLKVIAHKKSEVTLPFLASIGVKLYHLFPKTFDRLLAKQMNRK